MSSFSNKVRLLPLIFIVVGAVLMHLYLYSVRLNEPIDINTLYGGVFLQSIGLLLLVYPLLFHREKSVNKNFFIICVLVLSFSITFIEVTRFPVPFHTDAHKEYEAAVVTKAFWNPGLATQSTTSEVSYAMKGTLPLYDFVGLLSVTTFPAVVSNVMGIDMAGLFTYFYPLIVALMPLAFFIAIRRFLGDSPITYLSTALIPPYLAFNTGYMQFYRSAVAIFMLYIIVFCMMMKGRNSWLLAGLLGIGVVTAHLTVGYFGAVLFTFFVLAGVLRKPVERLKLRWNTEQIVNPLFFVGFIIIVLVWGVYVNLFIFTEEAHRVLYYLTSGLMQMAASPEANLVAGAGGETILTAWFDLEFLLIGLGALIGLYMVLKGRLRKAESTWIICGLGGIGYILATTFLNSVTRFGPFLEPNRVIIYLIPFVASFLALSLISLIKAKRKYLVFLVIPIIVLMIPMNMILPSNDKSLIFQTRSALTPYRYATYGTGYALGEAYVAGANWIRQSIGTDEFVRVDSVGYAQMIYGLYPVGRMDISLDIVLMPHTTIPYLVATDTFLENGIWYLISGNRTTTSMVHDPNSLLQNTAINLVYNDEAIALFSTS